MKEGIIRHLAFRPDGKSIVAGVATSIDRPNGIGCGVVEWNVDTRKRFVERPIGVKTDTFHPVAFSPDGKTIATGHVRSRLGRGDGLSFNGVALWEVPPRSRLVDLSLGVSEGDVVSVAHSRDGKTLAAGYRSAEYRGKRGSGIVVWDPATGKRLVGKPLGMLEGNVSSIAFSPDGMTIAAGCRSDVMGYGEGGGVVLWNVAARRRDVDTPIESKGKRIAGVAFSPDGKTLAAAYFGLASGSGVLLWNVETRKPLIAEPLRVNKGEVTSIAFSPEGEYLAAGYGTLTPQDLPYGSGGVVLWKRTTLELVTKQPLAVKEGYVRNATFSPDGKKLAAGYATPPDGGSGGVVLWDVATRKRLFDDRLSLNEGAPNCVAFSPDGNTLAAGYHGSIVIGGVVLWDITSGRRLVEEPFSFNEGEVRSISFSLDGKTVAAGYGGRVETNGGVFLLMVDPKSWQRTAGRIANRNFTRDEWRQYFPDMPYRATFPALPVPPEETPNEATSSKAQAQ